MEYIEINIHHYETTNKKDSSGLTTQDRHHSISGAGPDHRFPVLISAQDLPHGAFRRPNSHHPKYDNS